MKINFAPSMVHLLGSEGGFSNHPKDPGGMTNLGVTKATWERWVGHTVSEADMRALTPEKISPMYKRKYWDAVSGDALPSGLDYAVFDAAVNSGPGQAANWLQRIVQVDADGAIGPKTLAALSKMDARAVLGAFKDYRLAFMQSLDGRETFGKGWGRRVTEVTATATLMMA